MIDFIIAALVIIFSNIIFYAVSSIAASMVMLVGFIPVYLSKIRINSVRLKLVLNLYYLLGFVIFGYAFYLSSAFFYLSVKDLIAEYQSIKWLIYILAFVFISLHFRVSQAFLDKGIDKFLKQQDAKSMKGYSPVVLLCERVLLESIKFSYWLFYLILVVLFFFPNLSNYDLDLVHKAIEIIRML
jgi:hypothetical protein